MSNLSEKDLTELKAVIYISTFELTGTKDYLGVKDNSSYMS